jgi:hypothetical protein
MDGLYQTEADSGRKQQNAVSPLSWEHGGLYWPHAQEASALGVALRLFYWVSNFACPFYKCPVSFPTHCPL